MDPKRSSRKRKLYEVKQECSVSESSSFVNVSEPESKRIAFTLEESEYEPVKDPREKVWNWLEKNPSSPKPSTPQNYFLFAEDDPNPEATRGMKSSSFIAN
ncbi:hypothetical protein NPIL_258031 [Nephila pilipes]|uniref:Uncharacterized protein n=1 Tax=Nephila pilipes TaxID=299642 RepID=A0A8X6PQF8_NEPPI|nr:hypothetical protein NPIL_258031 [Nephila pilipes]